jgi:hypothetical protein
MSCDGLGDTNGNNVMFVFDEVKWYRREQRRVSLDIDQSR